MTIEKLRWFTRLLISIVELFLIGMIIYFLFFGSIDMDSEKTNLLSVIIGGLLLNFGKTSGFYFSSESEMAPKDKIEKTSKK
tara:strand:- start:411 stop:656 length:246 start_codon:yes stop_codon:yes gene_type:complete